MRTGVRVSRSRPGESAAGQEQPVTGLHNGPSHDRFNLEPARCPMPNGSISAGADDRDPVGMGPQWVA